MISSTIVETGSEITNNHAPQFGSLAESEFRRGRYWEATLLAYPLARQGNTTMQRLLGVYYESSGLPQNFENAVYWHRLAAERGDAMSQDALDELLTWDSQYRIHGMWENGSSAADNYETYAREYLKPGSKSDLNAAAGWYGNHAADGDANAEFHYGMIFYIGVGKKRDYVRAHKWFRAAAAQGHSGASNMIGFLYLCGQGVRRDEAHAREWFREAAENGNARCQLNLAAELESGRRVSRDYKQAALWYQKAAAQGNAFAQKTLAELYLKGRGVPVDVVLARMWFGIAMGRSDFEDKQEPQRKMEELERKMSACQVAEAQRRAKEWTPYPECPVGGLPDSDTPGAFFMRYLWGPLANR